MKKYPGAVTEKRESLDIDHLRGKTKRKKKEYYYEGKWIREFYWKKDE